MSEKEKLFTEFPPVSTPEWEEKIKEDLKGADYEKKLIWQTIDGLKVKPYYRSEDLNELQYLKSIPGKFPFIRGTKKEKNDWHIRQDIKVEDITYANKKALDVLMKGVTSIGFIVKNKTDFNLQGFTTLLNDIQLESIELNIIVNCFSSSKFSVLVDYIKNKGYDPKNICGSVEFDPIGKYLLKGKFCCGEDETFNNLKEIIEISEYLPAFKAFTVRGENFHNAGSSIIQETAFSLACGVEYINQLTALGLTANEVAGKMKFNLSVGSNYFMEIAKFRAIRYLWAKILEAYNSKQPMQIHAHTSLWNKTLYDPFVNLLRTTTESMSAIIAGVDSLTVGPYNEVFEETTDFSERIARNQQIVLKEEAYFEKNIDPSAGSYYIEKLTDSIIEHSWELFLKVGEKGGFLKAIKEGFVQNEIKKIAQQRDARITSRRDTLLGVNQFPEYKEVITKSIDPSVIHPIGLKDENAEIETLKLYRGSQVFEALRLRTDEYTFKNKRPKVFMLTYGNVAMRRARAQFSCNFFATAGFDVIDSDGFNTIEEGVKGALDIKAEIIVVCSADEEYITIAPEINDKLKGKALVVVAGYPADAIEVLKLKGVTNFIHVKSNVLETLEFFQKELGIN